jgi:hypothetical protein
MSKELNVSGPCVVCVSPNSCDRHLSGATGFHFSGEQRFRFFAISAIE